jgi:hypothetical protein
MARFGKYGILNVVIHPHPLGAYRGLFEVAGNDPMGVRFHGDLFATLSPISNTRNGVFTGKLAIWTEIDPSSNLIEKRTLKETLLSDASVQIPDGVGFNSRVFSFAFREADHRLYVELINDEGQTISIGRAKLAVFRVLAALQPQSIDELDVHIVSQENAVEKVLAIPKLRKLLIQLDLPNPDDLSEEKRKILEEIERMGGKRIRAEITKSAGEESLEASDHYRAMAELAKDNGYVSGIGRDENGEVIQLSTKSYPNEIEVPVQADASRSIMTRVIAEQNDGG